MLSFVGNDSVSAVPGGIFTVTFDIYFYPGTKFANLTLEIGGYVATNDSNNFSLVKTRS